MIRLKTIFQKCFIGYSTFEIQNFRAFFENHETVRKRFIGAKISSDLLNFSVWECFITTYMMTVISYNATF